MRVIRIICVSQICATFGYSDGRLSRNNDVDKYINVSFCEFYGIQTSRDLIKDIIHQLYWLRSPCVRRFAHCRTKKQNSVWRTESMNTKTPVDYRRCDVFALCECVVFVTAHMHHEKKSAYGQSFECFFFISRSRRRDV